MSVVDFFVCRAEIVVKQNGGSHKSRLDNQATIIPPSVHIPHYAT